VYLDTPAPYVAEPHATGHRAPRGRRPSDRLTDLVEQAMADAGVTDGPDRMAAARVVSALPSAEAQAMRSVLAPGAMVTTVQHLAEALAEGKWGAIPGKDHGDLRNRAYRLLTGRPVRGDGADGDLPDRITESGPPQTEPVAPAGADGSEPPGRLSAYAHVQSQAEEERDTR
jgi:hypothetical protein